MCRRHHSIPLQRTTIIYFRPKPLRGKPTKSAVDTGRAFVDVYIEKRPAEVHLTGRNKTVSILCKSVSKKTENSLRSLCPLWLNLLPFSSCPLVFIRG